jgi:hypothetical protein
MRRQSMLTVRYKTFIHVLLNMAVTCMFVTFTLILLIIPGCVLTEKNQVNIYLLEDEAAYKNESARMFMVPLVSTPIISNSDIVTYDSEQHQIELTPSSFEKLKNIGVPVNGGRSFIVCVGIVRVYMGALWSPLSSISSEGVIIQQPLSDDSNNHITIQLGYPNESFFRGNDPRSDNRIMQALKNTGKLR